MSAAAIMIASICLRCSFMLLTFALIWCSWRPGEECGTAPPVPGESPAEPTAVGEVRRWGGVVKLGGGVWAGRVMLAEVG